MDLLQSTILGLIQGTTEWLPISSTGHLRIAEHFFGLNVPLLFDVTLHVGTLLVVLIYFHAAIKNVLLALWHRDFSSEDGRLIVPLILGTIPTALIAVLVGNELDAYLSSLLYLGVGFIAGGIVLFVSKFSKESQSGINTPTAILIGVMQGLAIIPSISRSGLTIAVALLLGVKKEIAFKFSFLLLVPAVFGALGLTLYQAGGSFVMAGISGVDIAVALAVCVGVSFITLTFLWKTLKTNLFYLFSIYTFAVGALLIALSLMGY